MDPHPTGAETVDQAEVARFSRLAAEWWDPRGPMAALHKFNPVRLAYIRDRAAERFGRDARSLDSLAGLRLLDIGCGGGILCEPLARLGASVLGVDPSAENIAVARAHAARSGLPSITAIRPPKRWPKQAKRSTSFLPWKWSSMSPMSASSSDAPPPW